jgi:release factor glutamine methyltransferase
MTTKSVDPTITIKDYNETLIAKLSPLYDAVEAKSIANLLITNILNMTNSDLILHYNDIMSGKSYRKLIVYQRRLLKGEPIHYLLGKCYFYGLKFIVNNHVLIPRQDTEILIDFIIKKHKNEKNLKILDICSGSGCIAISLKKNLPTADIYAVELSDQAIEVMEQNCALNGTNDIKIFKHDVLSNDKLPFDEGFDIVVSNPPYILESEKATMHKNVVNFEPAIALFVPDDNPLLFYKKIYENFIEPYRVENLYFEVNSKFANDVMQIDVAKKFVSTKTLNDFNGNIRFVCFAQRIKNLKL